jgi:hypothetical protein
MTSTILEEPVTTRAPETPVAACVVPGEETCQVPGVSEAEGAAPLDEVSLYGAVLSCCCDLRQP